MTAPRIPGPWQERLLEAARERAAHCRDRSIQEPAGIDFSSNDYLGLRRDARLAEAGRLAALDCGSGSGASRLLRGTSPLHDRLEAALARWKGQEACLLFNTGFQCNATVIPALLRPGDAIFSDALNHASIVDGCRMARSRGAHLRVYHHLDLGDLRQCLLDWEAGARREARALVVTDAVFSMDGDTADLPGLLELCHRHRALLMADEAHASGLLGPTGAGLAEAQGVHGEIPVHMGTLGKALGTFGAFIACATLLREHLVNHCRGFVFSTALPPSCAGAALEGLRLAQEEPWRRERALAHAARIRAALGLPEGCSPIVPIVIGPEADALRVARELQARGFDVRAVRPPTVPEGTSRLRLTTGAHLAEAQVDALIEALGELL